MEALSQTAFADRLTRAADVLSPRKAALEALGRETSVIVYSYGVRGQDLALQLRARGVACAIFDNSPKARARAERDGFEVAADLSADLPLIVAAGQNQVEILDDLARPAWSLADALWGFDLRNSYGPARAFSEMTGDIEPLYARYRRLEPQFRADFLDVLAYRASLDVRQTDATRRPVGEMWTPPAITPPMTSFCDVGAFDGDTLTSMKAALPNLARSFTVEPGEAFLASIDEAARRNGLQNRTFAGAAWDRRTTLSAEELFNGMFAIREDEAGDIPADRLDDVTGGETYDYIKYDVERAERQALSGSPRLLNAARCIAVASYHLPGDLVALPDLVESLLDGPDWRCGFRHYSQSFDDSIFYVYRSGKA
jgi:FkbM family methyltransferase